MYALPHFVSGERVSYRIVRTYLALSHITADYNLTTTYRTSGIDLQAWTRAEFNQILRSASYVGALPRGGYARPIP